MTSHDAPGFLTGRHRTPAWLALLVAALGAVLVYGALSDADPQASRLAASWQEWREDPDLRQAVSRLSDMDRKLLLIWMSRRASGETLHARTVGEALREIRELGARDAKLGKIIALAAARREMPENARVTVSNEPRLSERSTPEGSGPR